MAEDWIANGIPKVMMCSDDVTQQVGRDNS